MLNSKQKPLIQEVKENKEQYQYEIKNKLQQRLQTSGYA